MSTSNAEERSKLILLVAAAWESDPSVSLGTVLGSVAYEADGHTDLPLISDEALRVALERMLAGGSFTGWEPASPRSLSGSRSRARAGLQQLGDPDDQLGA